MKMNKSVVTLISSALGLVACNNSISDVNAIALDSDATSKSYMIQAIEGKDDNGNVIKTDGDVTFLHAPSSNSFCGVGKGALLSVSSIEYKNTADKAANTIAGQTSAAKKADSKSFLVSLAANDGAGLKKFDGYFNDRANRRSSKILVNCTKEIQKKEYTTTCNNWVVVSENGEKVTPGPNDNLCTFLTKRTAVAAPVKPEGSEQVMPTESVGETIELSQDAYFKPRKEDNSVAPQDSTVIAYCTVKKGIYRIKERATLEAKHYKFTLVEHLAEKDIVAAFKPGKINDPSKEACKGLSFFVYVDQVKGQ